MWLVHLTFESLFLRLLTWTYVGLFFRFTQFTSSKSIVCQSCFKGLYNLKIEQLFFHLFRTKIIPHAEIWWTERKCESTQAQVKVAVTPFGLPASENLMAACIRGRSCSTIFPRPQPFSDSACECATWIRVLLKVIFTF